MKKLLIALTLILVSFISNGQISGRVIDSDSLPVPFVSIGLSNTTIGTTTDFDGNFTLDVPDGSHSISFSSVGFESKIQTINSPSNGIIVSIKSESTVLESFVVVGELNMESEESLLMIRKEATNISQTLSVDELSKKGISNVSDGLNKIVGVSITDQINVRGLGDRYNQITLNYLPLPSSNPEFKNIDLTLLDKDFVSSLNIYKTSSANLYSESTGAQFNINTKQINKTEAKVKLGLNYNSFNNKLSPLFRYNHQYKWDNYRLYYSVKYSKINDYVEGTISEYNTQGNQMLNYDFKNNSEVDNVSLSLINKYYHKKFSFESVSLATLIKSNNEYVTYGSHFDYSNNLHTVRNTPFNQNSFIQQLNTNYKLNLNNTFDLRLQYSMVNSGEKNRTQLVYLEDGGNYTINNQDFLDNHSFSNTHNENQLTGNLEYHYDKEKIDIKTGLSFNNVSRNFNYEQYYYNFTSIDMNNTRPDIDPNSLSSTKIYDPSSETTSKQSVSSAYIQNTHVLKKVSLFYGIRLDYNKQNISYIDQLQFYKKSINNIEYNLLPNLGMKFKLNDKSIFRSSYAMTVTRPRFRELTPFEYTQFFAGTKMVGNPYLVNSVSNNIDISYEFYPRKGELLGINVFYKNINNPIESVFVPTASGRLLTYQNSESANLYGVEFEVKKKIKKFTIDLNTSLLYSKVEVEDLYNSESQSRPLQGSIPFILNLDVLYNLKNSTFGIVYNRTGYKLMSFGVQGMGDIYQTPFDNLNFVYRNTFKEKLVTQFKVSNILGNDYILNQEYGNGEDLNVRTKKLSPNISISLEYKF